jgi:hypothetical protein
VRSQKKAAPEKVRLAAYSEPAHRLVRRNRVRIHQPSHSIEWLLPEDGGVTPGSEQRARNLGSPDNSKGFPHVGHWVRRCSHASLRRSARPDARAQPQGMTMTDPKLEVLTPQNSQVIFIDHPPQMAFGVAFWFRSSNSRAAYSRADRRSMDFFWPPSVLGPYRPPSHYRP